VIVKQEIHYTTAILFNQKTEKIFG